MKRQVFFNYIEERLLTLASRIEKRGQLNILDLNLHSENFYMYFMNELFGWELENCNAFKQNVEAIDLKDINNRIIAQVSATATKEKIDSALVKDLSNYSGYSFKFISICKDADHLRGKSYKMNANNALSFDPMTDIIDIKAILKKIETLDIEHIERIHVFIEKELGKKVNPVNIESNLTKIIEIIAAEDWDLPPVNYSLNDFDIDRKVDFNNLKIAKILIEEYKIHFHRLDEIYSEFDRQGVNKSSSVLNSINKMYLQTKIKNPTSNDVLYSNVRENILDRIRNSSNYKPIPFEELEMCIEIILVHAFINCKIFENPEGYNHVIT